MSTIFIYSSLSAASICIALSFLTYFKNRRQKANRAFALLLLSIGVWTLFPYFSGIIQNEQKALFIARLVYLAAIFTPANFLWAISVILAIEKKPRAKNVIIGSYFISLSFLPFSFSNLFIKGLYSNQPNSFVDPGPLYILFVVYFGLVCIYTFINLFFGVKHADGLKRNQLKYVLAGFIVAFIGGAIHVFTPYLNIEIIPHDIFIISFALVISYAIVTLRLMDIKFAIKRLISNLIIAISISAIMVPIALMPFVTLIKVLLILLLCLTCSVYIPKIKKLVDNLVNRVIYKNKYNYLNNMDEFIDQMVLISDEDVLLKEALGALVRNMDVSNSALFVIDPVSNDYVLRQKIGLDGDKDCLLARDTKIVSWLRKYGGVFVIEEVEKMVSPNEIEIMKGEIKKLDAQICVPIMKKADLLGVITLGNKKTGEMYSHLDLELLERLGLQLAVALDYRRIEAQFRKEHELSAIGILAMEIGHEMRNLLVAPYTFVEMIDERKDDPEFMSEFKTLSMDRLRVIRGKLDDIMYFGKDHPIQLSPGVDLDRIIEDTIVANGYGIKNNEIEIVKEYESVPTIKGDHAQLVHLFNNLVLNAIDAMSSPEKKGGKLRLRLNINKNINAEMKGKSNKWVRVEIKDDGEGIPEHIRKKLFTPFVTTKSGGNIQRRGTGLGLSVVKKAVDAHKGYIYINSTEGKGSTMIIDLPVDLKEEAGLLSSTTAKKSAEPWDL